MPTNRVEPYRHKLTRCSALAALLGALALAAPAAGHPKPSWYCRPGGQEIVSGYVYEHGEADLHVVRVRVFRAGKVWCTHALVEPGLFRVALPLGTVRIAGVKRDRRLCGTTTFTVRRHSKARPVIRC